MTASCLISIGPGFTGNFFSQRSSEDFSVCSVLDSNRKNEILNKNRFSIWIVTGIYRYLILVSSACWQARIKPNSQVGPPNLGFTFRMNWLFTNDKLRSRRAWLPSATGHCQAKDSRFSQKRRLIRRLTRVIAQRWSNKHLHFRPAEHSVSTQWVGR